MPRRHNRDGVEPEPLNLDEVKPRRRERTARRAMTRAESIRYHEKQLAAARRKRVKAALTDWEHCLVPGCQGAAYVHERQRDVDLNLPICNFHAVVVKQSIEPSWSKDDDILQARREVQEHREQVREGAQRTWAIQDNGGDCRGQIYFLRLNGLVKVGWSSDLPKRLKAYGPDVVLLCHYPGSRQDETLLHRQLRPYLAKGREWYEDCKLIEDEVARIVSKHGQPYMSAYWTQPKAPTVKLHRRSA